MSNARTIAIPHDFPGLRTVEPEEGQLPARHLCRDMHSGAMPHFP
jgi:hypothetical protein